MSATTARDDVVRDKILRFLFEGSKRRTSGFKTTEIERSLKEDGIKQGEVRSNLPYLEDNDWIVKTERERTFRSKRGTFQPATETKYRISAKGKDLVNGMESPYTQNRGKYAGIHIENVHGTVILGDNNVVSEKAVEVVEHLDRLAKAVEESPELTDQEKHDYSSDLAVLRAAISRTEPNRSLVQKVFETLEPLANVAGLAGFAMQLQEVLTKSGLL
jgi:hypothetical protein